MNRPGPMPSGQDYAPMLRAGSKLPRLMSGMRGDGAAMSLAEHLDRNGHLPAIASDGDRATAISAIDASGVLGRGGGMFPTARKIRAVAANSGWRNKPVVIVNGAEGELLSRKDALLLRSLPHLPLDGAVAVARIIGASEVVVAVHARSPLTMRALEGALAERSAAVAAGRLAAEVPIRLTEVPERYISGESSALAHWVDSGIALPRTRPPHTTEKGAGGKPTLVNNAETFAHLSQIVRFGSPWYRLLGTDEAPGTTLLTLSGAIVRPGVIECAFGTPLDDVVGAAGGPRSIVRAYLFGGYGGTWVRPDEVHRLRLSSTQMAAAGVDLGCGIVHVYPDGPCPLHDISRVLHYLAGETAGQCGPCVYGLPALATAFDGLVAGNRAAWGAFERVRVQVEGRGACHMPDGVVRFATSAIRTFADEFERHARHGNCPPHQALLPLPAGIRDNRTRPVPSAGGTR